MKIIFTYIIVILAVLGLGYWLFTSSNKSQNATLPGTAYTLLAASHITEGSTDHTPYNSNPPSSGEHWPVAANWGVYDTTQPDERLVHNLEHGGIWISYKPSVDADTVAKLRDFAKRYHLVIVEPREKDDGNIAFVSWGYVENFNQYDESAMVKFIEAHYNKGPEKVDE